MFTSPFNHPLKFLAAMESEACGDQGWLPDHDRVVPDENDSVSELTEKSSKSSVLQANLRLL